MKRIDTKPLIRLTEESAEAVDSLDVILIMLEAVADVVVAIDPY